MQTKLNVTMYYRSNCPKCDEVRKYLEELQSTMPYQLILVDIDSDPILFGEYENSVPYLVAGPYRLKKEFSQEEIRVMVSSANERHHQLIESSDMAYQERLNRSQSFTRTDGFSLWLSKHYMAVFNALLAIYVGLPFLAPILIKAGWASAARVIYTIYSPLCHQLAFRSFFLFGEQPYYPRELAGVPVAIHFEEIADEYDLDYIRARAFIGDQHYGYKVAFCQRDTAIYGALLLFGVVFSLSGRKIKPLKWYLWFILAILPMGLDGISQMPGLLGNILPSWLPVRESTPFLRILTGGMFGIFTGWYLYPYIEESMRGTRTTMAKKLAIVRQLNAKASLE